MFYWPLLGFNMVSSVHAVLQDYRLLTFWLLWCGTREGFTFPQLLPEVLPAEWDGGNRE